MRMIKLLLAPLVVAVAAAGFTLVPNVAAHADYCPFETLKHDAGGGPRCEPGEEDTGGPGAEGSG